MIMKLTYISFALIIMTFNWSYCRAVSTAEPDIRSYSGVLPRALGNMSYLTSLDLHGNSFTGEIPWALGNLLELEYLDFSSNKFSGRIPDSLCSVLNLNHMILAGNRLEGPVPRSGICQNMSRISVSGNKALCGGILNLQCPETSFRSGSKLFNLWSLASIAIGTLLITIFITFVAIKRIHKLKKKSDCEDPGASNSSSVDQNLYLGIYMPSMLKR